MLSLNRTLTEYFVAVIFLPHDAVQGVVMTIFVRMVAKS